MSEHQNDERFFICVQGGRLAEDVTDLLLSRAKSAWAKRGDATSIEIDLGDLSVPEGLKAKVCTLPETKDPTSPSYARLVSARLNEAGTNAVLSVLQEMHSALSTNCFVVRNEPTSTRLTKLALVEGVAIGMGLSGEFSGVAIVGEPQIDETTGVSEIPLLGMILEDLQGAFTRPWAEYSGPNTTYVHELFWTHIWTHLRQVASAKLANTDLNLTTWFDAVSSRRDGSSQLHVFDMILRPTQLPIGVHYIDTADPLKAMIVVMYNGATYEQIICSTDATNSIARAGDMVFRDVEIKSVNDTAVEPDNEPNDGSAF